MKKKKLHQKDKNLLDWVKKGGRDNSKKDFLSLVKLSAQPSKTSQKRSA
jgi:hypothetical protein